MPSKWVQNRLNSVAITILLASFQETKVYEKYNRKDFTKNKYLRFCYKVMDNDPHLHSIGWIYRLVLVKLDVKVKDNLERET